jgi:hypothetical protein
MAIRITADRPCEVSVEQSGGRSEDETCQLPHRHHRLMDLRSAMICDRAD